MAVLKLILIVCFVSGKLKANEITTDDEPSNPLTETYVYRDTHIILFAQQVTWDEADIICSSYHARLAVLDTLPKAKFLSEAMAESNIQMDDIWIGGRYTRSNWWWAPTGDIIPPEPGTDGYPPWARPAVHRTKQCLAVGRHNHEKPHFVDLDCRLLKPFVCEKSKKVELARPVPTKWIRANGNTVFVLYQGRLTWTDSVAYCRQQGNRLAIVSESQHVNLLDHAMKYARPDFESVWIGAAHRYDHWMWVSTGEVLPSTADQSNFPPWRHNSSQLDSERSCLVLDRHKCDHPVFLETSCERKRDFVCEEYREKDERNWIPSEIEFQHKGRHMVLHMKDKTWHAASEACWSAGSRLVTLEDNSTVTDIMEAMAEHPNEPTHVWIGGELCHNTWKWSMTGEVIPFPDDHDPDWSKTFPPWSDVDRDRESSCLNLDRRVHSKPMMYGLGCRNKQPFICEVDCRQPGVVPHGNWKCDIKVPPLVTAAHSACEIGCDRNFALIGSNVMQCLPRGWVGRGNSTSFPRCLCARAVTRAVIRNFQAHSTAGLLFVLDDSLQEDSRLFMAALQFISGIVRGFPLSSNRPLGLIYLPGNMSVLLPYTQTDSCEVLHELKGLNSSATKMKHGLAFDHGMKLVYEQITNNQNGSQTIVFFIGDNTTLDNYKKIIKLLKDSGHIIMIANIGNEEFGDLPDMASISSKNQLYFYGYTELRPFIQTAVHVTAWRISSSNCSVEALLPDLDLTGIEIPKILQPNVTTTPKPKLGAENTIGKSSTN